MLSEVICPVEFLALIAFPELVDGSEMLTAHHPVRCWVIRKLFATVAAYVVFCVLILLRLLLLGMRGTCIRRYCCARMESGVVISVERCARPRMASQMERVLMALGLIFVFESIMAVLAIVLFFGLMLSVARYLWLVTRPHASERAVGLKAEQATTY